MGMTLRACRVNKNLTQAEAAKKLGISRESLSNYELGRTFPDVPLIKKSEKLYGVLYAEITFMPEHYFKKVE